jgi:hypothetical protein
MTTSRRRRRGRGQRRRGGAWPVLYLLLSALISHRKAKARDAKAKAAPVRKPRAKAAGGGGGARRVPPVGVKPEPRYYRPDRKPFAPHGGWRPQQVEEFEVDPEVEIEVEDDEIEIPEDEIYESRDGVDEGPPAIEQESAA